MVYINECGDIRISKSETAVLRVEIMQGELAAGDEVIFAVKATASNEEELIHIAVPGISEGQTSFDVNIATGDFAELEFGTYKYDILLRRGDVRQYIVPMRDFIVEERVANAE